MRRIVMGEQGRYSSGVKMRLIRASPHPSLWKTEILPLRHFLYQVLGFLTFLLILTFSHYQNLFLLLLDDSFDEIWSDSQCRNIGRGIKNLEECKSACRGKTGCTAVNFCTKGNDCVFRACKEPIPAPTWKYRDDCKGHIAGSGKLLEVMNIE